LGLAIAASRSTSCVPTASCNGKLFWLPIRHMDVAISSKTLSCPSPKRQKNLTSTKRSYRNNRLQRRYGLIGCVHPALPTRYSFWKDAHSAATAPRFAHTDQLRSIHRTEHQSFLRIKCRAISVRMCRALRPVPQRRCYLSKDAGRYEWVSRPCHTESVRQGRDAMLAHRNVPRVPYRWILICSGLL
jgi:hypothetical protein